MKQNDINFSCHYIAHQLGVLDVGQVKDMDIEDYNNWFEYFSITNGTQKPQNTESDYDEEDAKMEAFFLGKFRGDK